MNSNLFGRKFGRFALVCLLSLILPFLNSCKKETTDVTDILSTVPSSASVVLGINLHSLLDKAGCTVKDSQITPGKELSEWLNSSTSKNMETVKLILNGDSGIDPVGALLFVDAYNSYLTAVLADTQKFIEFIQTASGNTFAETDGVNVCGNVAIIGAQMWVSLNNNYSIDAKAVKNYSKLESTQSFSQNPFAKNISEMTHDLVGWASTSAMMTQGMAFGNFAMMGMAMNATFDGASAASLFVDFKKGEAEADLTILNDKAEPAKYLFPTDKIDVDLVKSIGHDATFLMALSLTKETTRKIDNLSKSLGGNMFGPFLNMISSVDGTIAGALTNPDDPQAGISAAIATDGNPSLDLMNALSMLGTTKKDGKVVRLNNGILKGGLDIAEFADKMKGSVFAVAIDLDSPGVNLSEAGVKTLIGLAQPDKSGITFKFVLASTEPGENMLITILKKSK